MSSRNDWNLPESLATPQEVFQTRRTVLRALGFGGMTLAASPLLFSSALSGDEDESTGSSRRFSGTVGKKFDDLFPAKRNSKYDFAPLPQTPESIASTYNNFYEFTTDKSKVWKLAQGFSCDPWKVQVKGLVEKEFEFGLEELFRWFPLEERLYRFRCVEAWAMQVPWTGFALKSLVERCKPLGSAKYLRVVSLLDKERLPGQKNDTHWPWPYYEAFRLDEATHDLAFVAVGSYGHPMPMQHGAPWRIVMPWKYGFKSAKSLVQIEFTEKRPATFWNDSAPKEYGFYANVNPKKPHPRWSQATERDIGTKARRETLLYNGYAEEVGSLYSGEEF